MPPTEQLWTRPFVSLLLIGFLSIAATLLMFLTAAAMFGFGSGSIQPVMIALAIRFEFFQPRNGLIIQRKPGNRLPMLTDRFIRPVLRGQLVRIITLQV